MRCSLCVPFSAAAAAPERVDGRRSAGLRASAVAVALLLVSVHGHAVSKFTDPDDGAFDMSNLLLTHSGVLPVPTLITAPAVGYGLGLGLLHFSLPKKSADASGDSDDSKAPPNITGLGGFATGTHSWGAGLMHFHTWDDDHIRYLGVIAKVGLHLNYYGIQNQPRAYQLDGIALVQQVLFRIGNSHWYVGPRYTFFDASTRFSSSIPQGIRQFEKDQRVAKGGVVVDYDTRDNIFYPSSGTCAELEADLARGGLGSSTNLQEQTARGYQWIPLSKTWVLGLRADTGFSQGNIPFFAQPYVSLRGVSDAKFQDNNQLTAEAEIRWNVTPRWSVLGFGGVGKAYGHLHSFSDAPTAFGFGAGFRYLIARKLGVTMGIDVAHGPGQNAFYVQAGSAWR
ncbi:BamA/TamA family outer membrane protein [Paraburkholderia sp. BL23I1N1]|uniref:BamA/TamA family outer membrane protein n=1 Tax=Paraburkholderia sp. BL23I1N1 TaxID=1938802 RepID=UPI00217E06F3|nr:BamA/TamA family outer membrane protein [Paraburkholderia sp. BL23I1N1]